jgi:hypothetical protein
MKKSPAHNLRVQQAENRPHLRDNMKQGQTPNRGDAAMVGDTRAVMHNGGKSPKQESPHGKLRGIMHQ